MHNVYTLNGRVRIFTARIGGHSTSVMAGFLFFWIHGSEEFWRSGAGKGNNWSELSFGV
jgi:hypothetical protein